MKLRFLAIGVLVAALWGPQLAQAEPGNAQTPGGGSSATKNFEPAVIDGYRSAHFGMTESEVKKAIKADLGVDDPTRTTNDVERTTVMVVTGKTLLPETPPATVSYILGASSSKLIQVNVVWGDNGGADAKQIVATVNALTAYFLDKGSYAKDSLAVNQGLPDGTALAFRGADAKGHMVVLQLIPIPDPTDAKKDGKDAKDKPVQFKKAMLRLSYIGNPAKPDVFHIDKGQF